METINQRNCRTICLFFPDEKHYQTCMRDKRKFRQYVDEWYQAHPELFPAKMGEGYQLIGYVTTSKQDLKMRRLRLKANQVAYQIRPSFVMPSMIGRTAEVEKPLYLLQWGVPFEALAYGLAGIRCIGTGPIWLSAAPPSWGQPSRPRLDCQAMS